MPSSRIALREQIAAIRTVVENHDELAANAGYEGEQGHSLNIGDQQSRSQTTRNLLKDCQEIISAGLNASELDADVQSLRKAAARAYGLRAIRLVSRNAQSLEETPVFNIRNLNYSDLGVIVGSSQLRNKLASTIATFQYKLDPTDDMPFAFTWALMVDGQVISRGTQQPLQKFVASILKPMQLPDALSGDSRLNAKLREIADSAPTEKKWYFYLSNQNTTQHYLMFKQHRSIDSCMAKDYGFYTHVAPDQNPMDCYDNSPDWNLMFWSEQSPEQILAMLDACEENMDAADRHYKYPFLTRNMCLPVSKVLTDTRNYRDVHFVFGKIYGHDRVVNFFNQGSENPMMKHMSSIAGGRIPVLYSRRAGYEQERMLPYFDQANLARLINDDEGNEWWEATHGDWFRAKRNVGIEDRTQSPLVAKALYQEGVAQFLRAYSPAREDWREIRTCVPEGRQTMLGMEYRYDPSEYCNMTLSDGTVALIPRRWTVELNDGSRHLQTDCAIIGGEWKLISRLESDPRYTNHPDFGWMLTRQAELADVALGELRNG